MGRPGRRPSKGQQLTNELLAQAEQSVIWTDKKSHMRLWHWVVPHSGGWQTVCDHRVVEDLFWNTGILMPCSVCRRYTQIIEDAKASLVSR